MSDDYLDAIAERWVRSWAVKGNGAWGGVLLTENERQAVVAEVKQLRAEVERLGGCRLPQCNWKRGEPCDHGYLDAAIEDPSKPKPIDKTRRLGALMACGDWTHLIVAGEGLGSRFQCPEHGDTVATELNVLEPEGEPIGRTLQWKRPDPDPVPGVDAPNTEIDPI